MSLLDAVQIQQKQADLRGSPLRKLAALAPLFLGLFFVCAALASFGDDGARGHSGEERDRLMLLSLGVTVVVAWWILRQRRRITLLEIEVLQLRRRLEEESAKRQGPPTN